MSVRYAFVVLATLMGAPVSSTVSSTASTSVIVLGAGAEPCTYLQKHRPRDDAWFKVLITWAFGYMRGMNDASGEPDHFTKMSGQDIGILLERTCTRLVRERAAGSGAGNQKVPTLYEATGAAYLTLRDL